ncbi:hypothetical protein HHI36_013812 [Cryptolaemus montrouzieri]|uniref:Uncharacterized protein n=1 Tax=Cryptolaemus montrouzieri TaxID=559131 RepID=A0ABD2NIB6_9CUCU
MLDPSTQPHIDEEEKLHDWNIIPKNERNECDEIVPSKIGRKRLKHGPKVISWTVSDLAKAGCLLHSPPIGTVFEDEQEMRRVYTLIYDVFRYKNVLMQALNDINFFQIFEKLKESIPIVWLLFYDLYHRSFKKRETSVREIASRLFHHAKLSFVENALWCQKVKLAAAVSRLRIKYNALTLMDLLPSHLRGDKINKDSQNIPVTVWINNRKFKNNVDIKKQIEHTLKVKLVDDLKDLGPDNFKWDRHCPLTVAFHYSMRTQLAKSNLVRSHKLIVQDRSFCVGPATFWKVVEDLQLSGTVIQTHVNSPRSTAYLANLLAQNERIKKIMAFSAGRRKDEYETYLNELGMTNVVIYSDRLVDIGFESLSMEEVVAVYATPPNSYSAVTDPIDLQLDSKKEINNNENEPKEKLEKVLEYDSGDNYVIDKSNLMIDIPDSSTDDLKEIEVPETDLFDTPELPCLCPEETNCKMENGCYLALIQRKQVLRLDNKYMIQMAEQRGLFGSASNTATKQKSSKHSRKKQQIVKQELKPKKSRKKLKDFEGVLPYNSSSESTENLLEMEEEYSNNIHEIQIRNEYSDNRVAGRPTSGILGMLTQNQLKTLVSPSFEVSHDICTLANQKGKRKFEELGAEERVVRKRYEDIQISLSSLTSRKNKTKLSGTFNVKASPTSVIECRLHLKSRGKLSEDMIQRIATPTEATRIRSIKEENLPSCRRTDAGNITRGFLCECCKRRHS